MKRILVFVVCFLPGFLLFSQTTFEKTYGGINRDFGMSVTQVTDGGFMIIGTTKSFGGQNGNIYVIKTNNLGDTLWTRTFGGDSVDSGHALVATTDGGAVVVGSTNSFGTGKSDVYVIRLNANGDTLWSKTYGTLNDDFGYDIAPTNDSGYIITGYSCRNLCNVEYIYLIRADINGDTLWTKTCVKNAIGHSAIQTNDGGFIIAGFAITFNSQNHMYVVKTNENGDSLWSNVYQLSEQDGASQIVQTHDGGYIISGYSGEMFSDEFVYVVKTDSNGIANWSRVYGGNGISQGFSVYETSNHGYLFTGRTTAFGAGDFDVYLIKTTENGDTVWTKTYGGIENDAGLKVIEASDGGYIIVGSTESFGAGDRDVYLIKTDSNGVSGGYDGLCDKIITAEIFNIFPNPAKEHLIIETSHTSMPTIVSIFNIQGQLLLQQPMLKPRCELEVADLESGLYIIRIIGNEITAAKIFLKE